MVEAVSEELDLSSESLRLLMPFAHTLGIELVAATPAEVCRRPPWQLRPEGAGIGLRGGATMGLAEAAGEICVALNLPDGATGTTTIESKANYLRAARSGAIEARSRLLFGRLRPAQALPRGLRRPEPDRA